MRGPPAPLPPLLLPAPAVAAASGCARTQLKTTTSASRPWKPSTVPNSMLAAASAASPPSCLLNSARRQATCAL